MKIETTNKAGPKEVTLEDLPCLAYNIDASTRIVYLLVYKKTTNEVIGTRFNTNSNSDIICFKLTCLKNYIKHDGLSITISNE